MANHLEAPHSAPAPAHNMHSDPCLHTLSSHPQALISARTLHAVHAPHLMASGAGSAMETLTRMIHGQPQAISHAGSVASHVSTCSMHSPLSPSLTHMQDMVIAQLQPQANSTWSSADGWIA